MEGKHGSVYIGDFVDLVHRNAYRPNIRFIASRWGKAQGAPKDTCTLLAGAWLVAPQTDDPTAPVFLHRDHVGTYNVPMPWIPEYSTVDAATDRIAHRGWRALLQFLLNDRVIRPSPEILRWLGYKDFGTATRRLGCT